jgi:hypothetical protein
VNRRGSCAGYVHGREGLLHFCAIMFHVKVGDASVWLIGNLEKCGSMGACIVQIWEQICSRRR